MGNLLYFWLRAMIHQDAGEDCKVLNVGAAEEWKEEFPHLFASLGVSRRELHLTDRRERGAGYQEFGVDYTAAEVERFCRRFLLSSPGITRYRALATDLELLQEDSVTINVRRGDYYSNPEYEQTYGFDVRGFVHEAVRRQFDHGPFSRVFLISDDVEWCEENLGEGLASRGVSVNSMRTRDPMRDLSLLAHSPRLILANSTFSYWGGYMSMALNPEAHVAVPLFHARAWNRGRSFHLDPRWDAVDGFF